MTFEDDARSLESAAARFISALLLRFIHYSNFLLATRAQARFPVAVELRRPALRQTVPRELGRRPLT